MKFLFQYFSLGHVRLVTSNKFRQGKFLAPKLSQRNCVPSPKAKFQVVTLFTGCTQLRRLCKEEIPALLKKSLPSEWFGKHMVQWLPGKDLNHPPKRWLESLWIYLRDHFKEDLSTFENLPLIPLDLSKVPVTLTELTNPSRVVAKRLKNDRLDGKLSEVLKELGVILIKECPTFLLSHPAVLETFVHPPRVHSVLKAMEASSSFLGDGPGMHSAIMLDKVKDESKRFLRKFISKTPSLSPEEKSYVSCLPIFETLTKVFVSKKHGLGAAPEDPIPVALNGDFIDVSDKDSKDMAGLLEIGIPTLTEFVCDKIFPDVGRRWYSEEEIDKLMSFVIERYHVHLEADDKFEKTMKALPFVPTNSGRVVAEGIFDPREALLQDIFADEDVFPVREPYLNPEFLVILEKLGMKSEKEISVHDLLKSAKKVTDVPNSVEARQKSEAIMAYLEKNPRKLKETFSAKDLGSLLCDIKWVSALRKKPHGFPKTLHLYGETAKEALFYRPTDVTSEDKVNLIGTVMPIVKVHSQLAKHFGWNEKPRASDVVKHLKTVSCHYTANEKAQYIEMVKEIYSFLDQPKDADVEAAMQEIERSSWIWNGDGFSSSKTILTHKPPIDLLPYIFSLPSEVKQFSRLFTTFGMQERCEPSSLLHVLHQIKEKYLDDGRRFPHSEVKKDLQISVDILNEIKPDVGKQLPSHLQEKVLIPTHVEGDSCVRLVKVEDCMYCEHEWLERGNLDEEVDYLYVHPNVPNSTAELLQVPTLTNRMLKPDEMQIGDEFGQEEKLTDRLRRLLEEYTDGFSVLKELIQNADDAGATEVKFLYDKRNNKDAQTCLIDEGMRECQGPALWVYNDAEFRDEDFINITKLNGRTKETKTEKIGKFGLGFNAVYNLTDVPMFLSKNFFVIFDPSTLHLGKAIRNKSKPGMKIDVNKNTKRLRNFKNQFKPFNGIFGCDLLLEKEDNSFNGTLFRFPLRTRQQAEKSEIKNLHYNDEEMRQLLKTFYERRDLLLLFTQNVIRVGLYSLPSSSRQNPQPKMLFQVTKSLTEGGILRELSLPVMLPHTARKLDAEHQKLLEQTSFLQAASMVKRKAKGFKVSPKESCVSSIAVDVEFHLTNCGASFFKSKEASQESCTWLVVSSIGKGEAMEFARKDPSLVPSAGIAVQLLRRTENFFLPSPVTKKDSGLNQNGTIFCYLPLPMHSGLPVHINGAFAVTSSRRHLQEKLEDDKDCYGVKWNTKLMEDSITSAYFTLLEDVKSIVPGDGSYAFHSLWPKECEVQKHCSPVLTSFYKQLATGSHALFSDGNEWFSVNQVVFLHPNLRLDPKIGDISFAVFQQCTNVMDNVVDLPSEVFHSLVHCKQWGVIESKTYDIDRFFCEIFFPNISAVSSKLRDVLVLYALDQNKSDLEELLKSNKCIPVSPSGKILKFPKQLINPTKRASTLFCQEDGRFPCSNDEFRKPGRLEKLEDLGMLSDELPWEDIAERAESIPGLNAVDNKAAVKRVRAWLKLVEKKLKDRERPTHSVLSRLLVARFLPVLEKPTSFPLHWKGNDFHGSRKLLAAPKDIFLEEKKYQVCCTEPIVGLAIPEKVKELLDLEEKEITTHHAMKQLEVAFSTEISTLNRKSYDEVSRVCAEAYSFLQEKMVSGATSFENFFTEKRFILVGKTFLSANQVAFEVKNDCSPYLQRLPDHFRDEFADLMKVAGVREHFEKKDYIFGLQKVKRDFGEMKLDERALQVAINMAIQLSETLQGSNEDDSEPLEKWGALYLPDFRGIMRDVHDLFYKDCPWMPDDPDELSVHEKIPWSTCKQLGVKTRREGALQHHDAGFPFGQKEELTNRLKRILMGYPGEKEILKELLQNADDAQATEICFIKDPRHHPDEKVFKESWKPVQGPALCVYNNKPFTTADIEGICKLGEGSKGEDPNKTGQYGVGFNAVYHLTDVPSFISKGEEIGDVLCVFDPHCKYIPGASNAKPGRMFKGIEELKSKFPDVFPCYLEEHFPLENATMFRFPLKSEKMAKDSLISQTPVSMEKLEFMMKDLKKELFEVLLFANNVKKIGVASIDESGNLQKTYSVQVSMSNEDERERQAFAAYINKIGRETKEKVFLPTNITAKQCTYALTLQDNFGKKEKWLIVQQVGLEKHVKDSINVAFKDGKLGMLPRGGVACLLDCNTSEARGKKKAYCFLPLPFETDLPVHINGHFALDHEARRSLWRDEAGGYRSDWNNALLCDVVASCYLTLLHKVRGFLHLPFVQNRATRNGTFNRGDILKRLTSYENLFPVSPIEEPYWRTLVNSVFQEINTNGMRLLPLVRPVKTRSSCRAKVSDSEKVQVTWLPPTGARKEQAFFNDLDMNGCFASLPPKHSENEEEQKRKEEKRIRTKTKFEETLLETGFNLVALSLNVFHAFSRAGVPVRCISPLAVLDFYKSIRDPYPHCNIGAIPCHVRNTPFKDQGGVIRVLKYCKDDEQFLEKLPDLPLLLTQDNFLRRFSESDPRCLSQYADILPSSPSVFVNTAVLSEVFYGIDCGDVSVFQPLDVKFFATQLPKSLPDSFFKQDCFVKWRPDSQAHTLPNHRWIYRVWEFLRQFTNDVVKEKGVEKEKTTTFIRDLLSPLCDWNILPATVVIQLEIPQIHHPVMQSMQKPAEQILVPLKKAEAVLDFTYCGKSSSRLVEALRNLGLPELNKSVMLAGGADLVPYIKSESYEFAHMLVATLESPHSLILVLKEKLEMHSTFFGRKIAFSDAIDILEYFSRNTESLEMVDRETLRKLPFYPTATGSLTEIKNKNVFLLPGIPKEEMNVVESKQSCLFLDPLGSLSKLYEFLDLQLLPPVEVYLKFVLNCFKHLTVKGQLAHLRYLRQLTLYPIRTGSKGEEHENRRLLDRLKTVEFIQSIDGTQKTASSFYDPHNEVFCAMLTKDMFPPDPFGSNEWLPFLKEIGLVKEVSDDDFCIFASQVAQEAKNSQTNETCRKSEVLVCHLFSRHNVVGGFLLHRVYGIPFVAGSPVKECLRAICTPFGEKKAHETPFIAFKDAVVGEHEEIVWSKASLLPESADPRRFRSELAIGCPHYRNLDQYLNDLLSKLQILKKPPVDLVVSHCKTICLHLQSRNVKENASREHFSAITRVMESIYKFLQDNAIDDRGAKLLALQTTRCILIGNGKSFILPSQAVLDLYDKDEIKPFLYGVPPEFGKFRELFGFLGCSKYARPSHYAMVLEMLQESCKDARLSSNEFRICCKAVKGFFDTLQEEEENISPLSKLYLPAMPPGCASPNTFPTVIPVSLHQSKELIFDDAPTYGNRIRGLQKRFVLDLSLMDVSCKSTMVNFKDLMMKLPLDIQPKMLSSVVIEKLSNPEEAVIVTDGAVNLLKRQLSTVQFGRGIARIIRDANSHKKDFKESVIAGIEKGLRSIDLCAVKCLETSLFHNGILIPGSKAEVPSFQEKLQLPGEEIRRVYINTKSEMDDPISTTSLVTNVIVEMYGESLGKKAFVISDMLRYPPSKIWSLLDRMGIRKDDSYVAAEMDIYSEPGTLIPIEDHHLLNEAFALFEPDEYVGCQLDHPALHLDATFIYAIIIDEVSNEDTALLTKRYKINIGHDKEPVVVNSAKLYQFHRLKDIFDQQVNSCQSEQEVLNEITDLLKKTWELPQEERFQIIKRLCLRWHPEKNLGNEEFCRAVLQHIKNEVSRLGGSYDDLFAFCEARAREHGLQRKGYRERFSKRFGSWESSSTHRPWKSVPPSLCERNPQPEEAKRWFRQAEADLEASANELAFINPSFEWACFKCHQVRNEPVTDISKLTCTFNL